MENGNEENCPEDEGAKEEKGETGKEFGVDASGPHVHPLTWGDRKREMRTSRKNPGVRRRRHNMDKRKDKRKDKRLPGETVKEPPAGEKEKQEEERGMGAESRRGRGGRVLCTPPSVLRVL